eukprot:TRINITY_DN3709_c0_g3_i1.p1 TRINITY_DN3709_c0_g3~~TRINITY_DN3709_c0_g3_i1.p1  ORF type:complete len:845 (-),score=70.90 TRINITY_DN3709_c0_g3_i1:314-2827(-)
MAKEKVHLNLGAVVDLSVIAAGEVAMALGWLIGLFVWKIVGDMNYDTAHDILILNTSVASFLCAVHLFYTCWFSLRLYRANQTHKVWSLRRRRLVLFALLRLYSTALINFFYLLPNVYGLAHDTCSLAFKHVVVASSTIRFLFYNFICMLFVVEAHTGCVWQEGLKERKDAIVLDAPWKVHLPKFVLFGVGLGSVFAFGITSHVKRDAILGTPQCGQHPDCSSNSYTLSFTIIQLVILLIYLVSTIVYVKLTFQQLRKRRYQDFRMGNILVRLQVRLRMATFGIFLLSVVLLWIVDLGTCESFAFTWLGLLPVNWVFTCFTIVEMLLMTPKLYSKGSELGHCRVLLQQFSWTERNIESKKAWLVSQSKDQSFNRLPMFCYERCIKLFWWSCLVYEYGDKDEVLPEELRKITGIHQAMSMFNLANIQVFHEPSSETKVIIGWNTQTIVISFRGSLQRQNWINDLRAWQTPHPPKRGSRIRGTQPRVHNGFLRAWTTNKFNEEVLNFVKALTQDQNRKENSNILVTGHSLGGALAQLAAFDIKRHCLLSPEQISVYTYGCPRVGNYTWGYEYEKTVSDTWNLINNQDMITRVGKFIYSYKHAGCKVLINSNGDMVVRPQYIEVMMLRFFLSSMTDHFTSSYQQAFMSVLMMQLDKHKRQEEDLMGVLQLAKSCPIVKTLLQHTNMKNVTIGQRTLQRLGTKQLEMLPQLCSSSENEIDDSYFKSTVGDSENVDLVFSKVEQSSQSACKCVRIERQLQDYYQAMNSTNYDNCIENHTRGLQSQNKIEQGFVDQNDDVEQKTNQQVQEQIDLQKLQSVKNLKWDSIRIVVQQGQVKRVMQS